MAVVVLVSAVDADVSVAESDVSGDVSDEAALVLLVGADVESVVDSESDVSDTVCPSVDRVAVSVESSDSEESVEDAVS